MRTTAVYTVTRHSLGAVYGRAHEGEERLIAKVGSEWMPSVEAGDCVEIEYDESEDERGEPVKAWLLAASLA